MTTIQVDIPKDYDRFLDDTSEFQGIITEVLYDYVEKKQDTALKQKLSKNKHFSSLNAALEQKLGK